MNPAALKANLDDLPPNGMSDRRQGGLHRGEPEEGGLHLQSAHRRFARQVPGLPGRRHQAHRARAARTGSTIARSSGAGICSCSGCCRGSFSVRSRARSAWLEARFKKTPELLEANLMALKAGYNFGETTEMFAQFVRSSAGAIGPGTYRNITGNSATALGFVAAAASAGRPLFLGSYPITPASDILHELAQLQEFRGLHLPGRRRDRGRRRRRSAPRSAARSRSRRPRARACTLRPRRSASR